MNLMSATAILALFLVGFQLPQLEELSDDDVAWLDQHTTPVLDRFMPIGEPISDGVAFRSFRDLHYYVHERFFRVAIEYGPTTPHLRKALVVVPIGESIQHQLLNLHRADRTASIEQIQARIKVRRLELVENRCPAMQNRVNALKRLRMPVPSQTVFMVHPEVFRIIVDYGDGRVDSELFEQQHPLVRWALQTYDDLQKCPASPSK